MGQTKSRALRKITSSTGNYKMGDLVKINSLQSFDPKHNPHGLFGIVKQDSLSETSSVLVIPIFPHFVVTEDKVNKAFLTYTAEQNYECYAPELQMVSAGAMRKTMHRVNTTIRKLNFSV